MERLGGQAVLVRLRHGMIRGNGWLDKKSKCWSTQAQRDHHHGKREEGAPRDGCPCHLHVRHGHGDGECGRIGSNLVE